ncbi:MAG: YgiQ family radical SAM protein [Pseudomonadota bacterium]
MKPWDIIFVLPYPFTDHPSFPEGTLKRALEKTGFGVGVIETPFWQDPASFTVLGRPRRFFSIIPGPVDSMVLNYTALGKRRKEDRYQRTGQSFFKDTPKSVKYKIRPDRTVIVFANRIREAYQDVPIVIGGLEASSRCFAHYDFHQNRIRRSILLDTRADFLVAGMGEKQIVKIAQRIKNGIGPDEIIPGTARVVRSQPSIEEYSVLPDSEDVKNTPDKLLESQLIMEKARMEGRGLTQKCGGRWVVQAPPEIYTTKDLDEIYESPFTRNHLNQGPVSPALQMNSFSITTHRGCGGGCSFCVIHTHEGRGVISRSMDSIQKEIKNLIGHPSWKGYLSDLGGASAEMYGNDCHNIISCKRPSCLYPKRCRTFRPGRAYLDLLRHCRKIDGVKKNFLGSGIRFDIALENPILLEEIMRFHSGRYLRVAPEHTEDHVLQLMRKPGFEKFEAFVDLFNDINKKLSRKIDVAPYIILGHPGETLEDVRAMKKKLRSLNLKIKDVQIFTPTPGTLSTAMYWAEKNPSMGHLPVEKDPKRLETRKRLLLEL